MEVFRQLLIVGTITVLSIAIVFIVAVIKHDMKSKRATNELRNENMECTSSRVHNNGMADNISVSTTTGKQGCAA